MRMTIDKEEENQSVSFKVTQKLKWSAEIKVYAPNISRAYDEALKHAEKAEKVIKEKNKGEEIA